ncbi:hypothetical protein AVEN_211106-1, partial [Araneus ventricosus]
YGQLHGSCAKKPTNRDVNTGSKGGVQMAINDLGQTSNSGSTYRHRIDGP